MNINKSIKSTIEECKHKKNIEEELLNNLLDNLNLNYIDILILYYRAFIDYIEVWKILEKCVLSDKINKLGLYNFNINEIKDIIEKYNIKPFYYKINFELTLFFYSSEFIISVEELGISVLNYYSEQNNIQTLFDLFEELINKGDIIFIISIFKKFKSYNNDKNMLFEEKKNNIEKSDHKN